MVMDGKNDRGKEVSRHGSPYYEPIVGPKREDRVRKPAWRRTWRLSRSPGLSGVRSCLVILADGKQRRVYTTLRIGIKASESFEMPTATFSRRNTSRRQASSDIEEDRSPKRRGREAVDDEEDEDEQPRRRVNGVKKEKKVTSSRQAAKQPENGHDKIDDDDDGDDDDRIDVKNFRNQPLSRADLPKLQGISNDWQQMERQVQQNWNVIADVATSLADAAEGNDAEAVCLNLLYSR
jgi:hypothetical protein